MSWWLFLLLLSPANAATPATLVGPDLRPRAVSLQGLDERGISFFDADRVYRHEPLSQVVQLRELAGAEQPAAEPASAPAAGAWLELVDGQRLIGRWAGASPDGQALRWDQPRLGTLTIPLGDVQALTLEGVPLPQPPADAIAAGDRIALANGDLLQGFVEAATDEGIRVKLAAGPPGGGGGGAVDLPLVRVRAVRLANPPRALDPPAQPAAAPGSESELRALVFLADGSRLRAVSLRLADQRLTLTAMLAPRRQVDLPLSEVRRIDFAARHGAGELADLLELPRSFRGGTPFGVSLPPRAVSEAPAGVPAGSVLELQAPVSVEVTLPPGSRRMAARAELALDGPDAVRAAAWADVELLVRLDGAELGRWRLNAQQRTVELNLETPGRTLAFDLLPGVNGPIFARLHLRDAVVLVQEGSE